MEAMSAKLEAKDAKLAEYEAINAKADAKLAAYEAMFGNLDLSVCLNVITPRFHILKPT